jgi:tRNA(Ile2) C34 agmatinyltransferase TiaS
MTQKHEFHISECCKADLFFKGESMGFWCTKCKNEITHTIVAFTPREIKQLKALRDKHNPKGTVIKQVT